MSEADAVILVRRQKSSLPHFAAVGTAVLAAVVLSAVNMGAPVGDLRASATWLLGVTDSAVATDGAWHDAAAHTTDCDAFFRAVCGDAALQARLLEESGQVAATSLLGYLGSPAAAGRLAGADLTPRSCTLVGDANAEVAEWCTPWYSSLCHRQPWMPQDRAAEIVYGAGGATVTLRVGCPVPYNYTTLRGSFAIEPLTNGTAVNMSNLFDEWYPSGQVNSVSCDDPVSICNSAYVRSYVVYQNVFAVTPDDVAVLCPSASRPIYSPVDSAVLCTPSDTPAPLVLPFFGVESVVGRYRPSEAPTYRGFFVAGSLTSAPFVLSAVALGLQCLVVVLLAAMILLQWRHRRQLLAQAKAVAPAAAEAEAEMTDPAEDAPAEYGSAEYIVGPGSPRADADEDAAFREPVSDTPAVPAAAAACHSAGEGEPKPEGPAEGVVGGGAATARDGVPIQMGDAPLNSPPLNALRVLRMKHRQRTTVCVNFACVAGLVAVAFTVFTIVSRDRDRQQVYGAFSNTVAGALTLRVSATMDTRFFVLAIISAVLTLAVVDLPFYAMKRGRF